jgi:glycine cleavage system H protein
MFQISRRLVSVAKSTRSFSSIRFTKEHEYAKLDGKIATCGITNHAQTSLGDVVFVSLPEVGKAAKKGEALAGVESVKAASDVYAPVSGKVVAINDTIVKNPANVNAEAESGAWFVKIEVTDEKEFKALLDKKDYDAHVESTKH